MDETTGVTEAAPASDVPSSPGASGGDTASTTGATTGGDQATPATATPEPQPAVANDNATDAGSEDSQEFLSDEELAKVPDQWRSRFDSLRTGYKALESDHKAYKALGDVQSLQSGLGLLDGLYGVAQNEQGQIQYDQETGLPIPSTTGFVSQLAESSPALVDQLMMDIAAHVRSDGRSYAAHFFEALGLNVADIDKYAALSANPNNATSSQGGVITADELSIIPEQFHDVYKSLSASDRELCQVMDDEQLSRFLTLARSDQRLNQMEQRYTQDQQRQQEAQTQAFWSGVKQKRDQHIAKLRTDGLNSIGQEIASKVQFSSDPGIQAAQVGATMSVLASLLHPDLRFASEPLLQSLGVTLDAGFEQALEAVGNHAGEFIKLREIAGNPAMKHLRNDAQMQRAQGEMDSKYRSVMAKLSQVALAVGKALAGGNQELREVTAAQLQGAKQRPVIGGGKTPQGNGQQGGNPYNFRTQPGQWMAHNRAQRDGAA